MAAVVGNSPIYCVTQNFTFGFSVSPDSEFKLSSSGCVLGCHHLPHSPSRHSSTWIQLELRVYNTWLPNGICASALCLHGLHGPRRRADLFQRLSIRHSLCAQPKLQQIQSRNQDGLSSAPHSSAVSWWWRSQWRKSDWSVAPPTSAISSPRWQWYHWTWMILCG